MQQTAMEAAGVGRGEKAMEASGVGRGKTAAGRREIVVRSADTSQQKVDVTSTRATENRRKKNQKSAKKKQVEIEIKKFQKNVQAKETRDNICRKDVQVDSKI